MKVLYCWRCRMDIPMLDEQEFSPIAQLYSDYLRSTKDFRKEHNLPLVDISMEDRFSPVCEAYTHLTGFKETVANAVMHHRDFSVWSSMSRLREAIKNSKGFLLRSLWIQNQRSRTRRCS